MCTCSLSASRFLTGQVDKRTLEKYEREAKEKNRETWYLAWALDTNQEERNKVTQLCKFCMYIQVGQRLVSCCIVADYTRVYLVSFGLFM